jgi:hypothetical protein
MMRHASIHRRLFARWTTFILRIYASANDWLMPLTSSSAAEGGELQPLHCGLSPWNSASAWTCAT